jgi:hypothetical protein
MGNQQCGIEAVIADLAIDGILGLDFVFLPTFETLSILFDVTDSGGVLVGYKFDFF